MEELKLQNLIDVINMNGKISYLSIGSACNSQWKNEDDQQYPIFIRNFYEKHKMIGINLIIIDPYITLIPCLTEHKYKNFTYNNVLKFNNITVYVFKLAVTYIPQYTSFQISGENYDITSILELLNNKCLEQNGVLIVHDFSGQDINILNKYFYKYTYNHSDKILYDLSCGTQKGCFLNMCDPINHISFTCKNVGKKIFISINSDIDYTPEIMRELYDNFEQQTNIIQQKFIRYLEYMKQNLWKSFNNYRRAILWKNSISTGRDIDICKKVFKECELVLNDLMYETKLIMMYKNDDVDGVMEETYKIFKKDVNDIKRIFNINIEFVGNNPSSLVFQMDDFVKEINKKLLIFNQQ
jgi:hypothetical protein